MALCSESDVYAVTRPGSIPSEARLCASALAASDTFTLDGHGMETGDPVSFRAEDGGSLPAGISSGVTYYAIRLTDSTFQVATSEAAAEAGTEVNLTTDGDLVLAARERPMSRWIDWASTEVEQMLPAHVVPIDTDAVPTIVRAVTAKLAAYQARVWSGRNEEDLATLLDEARKMLARWARGVPLRGDDVPGRANLSAYGSATSTTRTDTLP